MPLVSASDQLELRARRVVESLDGTWSRSRGMCRCPAHPDRTPSLSVTIGRWAILFHCFAGCTNTAVIRGLATVGIGPSELFNGLGALIELVPRRAGADRHILRLWKDADILAGTRGLWRNDEGDTTTPIELCWARLRHHLERSHQHVESKNVWKYLGQHMFIRQTRLRERSPFWDALAAFPDIRRSEGEMRMQIDLR